MVFVQVLSRVLEVHRQFHIALVQKATGVHRQLSDYSFQPIQRIGPHGLIGLTEDRNFFTLQLSVYVRVQLYWHAAQFFCIRYCKRTRLPLKVRKYFHTNYESTRVVY